MSNKFKDTASVKAMERTVQGLFFFQGLLGEEIQEDFKETKSEFEEMVSTVDTYNEIFSDDFWVAHESISLETMKEAIEINNSKGIDVAEGYLCAYYEELFEKRYNRIFNTEYFRIRRDLFEKAYSNYLNQQYYAAIPIILMLCDGIVSDFNGTGLAAEITEYKIWDSISGLDSGMNKIGQIYNRTRTKTNKESISLPFRNGILHGRDLNYDNYLVATKCLALILYLFDWIEEVKKEPLKKEKYTEELKKIEDMKSISLLEMVKNQYLENDKDKDLRDEWKSGQREPFMIVEPETKTFEEDTPEYSVFTFFEYINDGNYGSPVVFLPPMDKGDKSTQKLAGELNKSFKELSNIKIKKMKVVDTASAKSDVELLLTYEYKQDEYQYQDNLITNYLLEGKSENRLVEGGQWVIMFLKELAIKMETQGTKIK